MEVDTVLVPAFLSLVAAFEGPEPNEYEVGPVLRAGVVAGRLFCDLDYVPDGSGFPDQEPSQSQYGSGNGPAVAGFTSLGLRLSTAWEVHLQVSWGVAALTMRLDGGDEFQTQARWLGLGAGFMAHPFTPGLVLGVSGLAAFVGPNGGGASAGETPTTGLSPLLEALTGYEWATPGGGAVGLGLSGSVLFARDEGDQRFVTTQSMLGLALFGRADL